MIENKASFFLRISDKLAPSELTRVRGAYIFAKFGHRAQKRIGEGQRYFEHCRRTAIILMDELLVYDPTLIITALSHDELEDSKDVDTAILELFFGPEVCRNVLLLTKTDKDSYIDKLYTAPEGVILVKACDRLDNLRSLGGCEVEFIERQVAETEEKLLPLFEEKLTSNKYAIIIEKIKAELEACKANLFQIYSILG